MLLLVSFLFIFLCSVWIYRYGLVALPRADHKLFIKERLYSNSEFEYFIKSIFFARTRQLSPGDYFLFRPGMTGLLGILDIFLGRHLFWIGILSVLWHALTSLVLYVLLRNLLKSQAWAVLLSALFICNYSGMEIIIWRHISPYILGFLFWMMGMVSLMSSDKKSVVFASIFFFISMLFHEAAVLALCTMLVFYLTQWKVKDNNDVLVKKGLLLKVFLIPLVIYGVCYLAYAICFKAPFFLIEKNASVTMSIDNFFWRTPLNMSAFVIAFIFPQAVHYQPNTILDRSRWDFAFEPQWPYYCLGAISLLLLARSLKYWISKFQHNERPKDALIFFLSLTYFGSIFFGISFGRTALRGIEYLRISLYYFYLTNGLFIILGILFLKSVQHSNFFIKFRTPVMILGFFLIAYSISHSYYSIQQTLKPHHIFSCKIASAVKHLSGYLEDNPDVCLAGSTSDFISNFFEDSLSRWKCTLKDDRTPLFAFENPNGNIGLARKIPKYDRTERNLPKSNSDSKDYALEPVYSFVP